MAILSQATDPQHPAVTAEAIPARVFVCVRASDLSGKVRVATNAEEDVAGLLGFAPKSASAEKSILLYRDGDVVPGFTGLTPGQEYHLNVSSLALASALTAGTWTKKVGLARSSTHLELSFGRMVSQTKP